MGRYSSGNYRVGATIYYSEGADPRIASSTVRRIDPQSPEGQVIAKQILRELERKRRHRQVSSPNVRRRV